MISSHGAEGIAEVGDRQFVAAIVEPQLMQTVQDCWRNLASYAVSLAQLPAQFAPLLELIELTLVEGSGHGRFRQIQIRNVKNNAYHYLMACYKR